MMKSNALKKTASHFTGRMIACFVLAAGILAGSVAYLAAADATNGDRPFTVVDTGQAACYDNYGKIACPQPGAAFYGQDAEYDGPQPSYTDNGDGTVTDNNTGLMWQQDPGEKVLYDPAVAGASACRLAGYSDWRLPTVKELYSLIQFSGTDPSGMRGNSTGRLTPFIDTNYFHFKYGDPSAGDRIIDSQWATRTRYVGTTMNGNATMFGVNFADGRIKGYPVNRRKTTTHANLHDGANAVYIAFGEALGWMRLPFSGTRLMDVHGAGAQRSDPKIGNPAAFPHGRGPQGDVIRIYNYVRCVRNITANDTPNNTIAIK